MGYDSVKPESDNDWTVYTSVTAATTVVNGLATAAPDANNNVTTDLRFDGTASTTASGIQIDAIRSMATFVNDSRKDFIRLVLDKRINRLTEIHNDNLLKIEAPFDLQLDLLDREIEDVLEAQDKAIAFANDYFTDLTNTDTSTGLSVGRVEDYLTDRNEALDREYQLVIRALDRAQTEGKDVGDVLAAMRIDWLQGVYAHGIESYFDEDIYDMTVFDNEFDIFTYDMGHGKGHGHTNQANRGQIRSDTGFVIGAGVGGNDLSTLKAAPAPVDGKTRRYDRATLSGNGGNGRVNEYEIGLKQSKADGAFGFDQAAQLGVRQERRVRSGSGAP